MSGVLRVAAATSLSVFLVGCSGSGGYMNAINRCVRDQRPATADSRADLAFALTDARKARVEVVAGGGQNRSGVGTEWTFAVPSRGRPEYVVVALKNALIPLPATHEQDVESFAIAVTHPERFDVVWFSRGQRARAFLARTDECISDEIVM
jgi:hypothetical protein